MTLKRMGPIEKTICALTEFEKEIRLLKQELYTHLPQRCAQKPKGYFIDHTGKRQYYKVKGGSK